MLTLAVFSLAPLIACILHSPVYALDGGSTVFKCRDGLTRTNVTACDGVWQCPGGEDENSCGACVGGALYCGGECFHARTLCNGIRDCPNGEDEVGCGAAPSPPASDTSSVSSCEGDAVDCGPVPGDAQGRRHCLSRRFACDGGADCANGVDEDGCGACRGDAFRCHSGWCEHKARCDGTRQCPGGEDELGCPPAARRADLFLCADGTTRLDTTRCDGWLACPGGEDERNCQPADCRDGAFFCAGVCKPASRRCDGVRHCPNGEDEQDCALGAATQPMTSSPPLECGRAAGAAQVLVANGTKAEAGAFPWHAALYLRQNAEFKYLCGASLVTKTVLLTAAHCFFGPGAPFPASNYSVAVGKLFSDWNAETYGVHKSEVLEYVVHPDYFGVEGRHSSDIAVVRMSREAAFSRTVSPVCLVGPAVPLAAQDFVTVAGWGNGTVPLDELAFVKMPFLTRRQCLQMLKRSTPSHISFVTPDKFCAQRESGVSTPSGLLPGDSGGGAVLRRAGKWHLVGIVSLGLDEGRVAAFTDIRNHDLQDWLTESYTNNTH